MANLIRRLATIGDEIWRANRMCSSFSGFVRLGVDSLAYRLSQRAWWTGAAQEVSLTNGIHLRYRRNRGDWWSFREVWLFGCYRLPFNLPSYGILVDLGGNIGLTSVWLTKQYAFKQIIVVEPVAENADLAESNLKNNLGDAQFQLIRAAIGPADGVTHFTLNSASNQGHISTSSAGSAAVAPADQGSLEVPVVSMKTLLKRLPEGAEIDVLKIDIEGGEQGLLDGDLSWLSSVRSIIIEFHPTVVDYPGLVKRIQDHGFVYLAAQSVFPENMDSFIRKDLAATCKL